jgi:lysine-N-methylase
MQERTLNHATPATPQYAQRFACIGSACEDTCCQGWQVPVDEATFERYHNLAPGPLPTLIAASLEQKSATQTANNPAVFAIIRMTAENRCPMLSADRLCRIQSAYGSELLSHTCATYPRVTHAHPQAVAGENPAGNLTALALSCPEAARLVLLTPNLLLETGHPAPQTGPSAEPARLLPAAAPTHTEAALGRWAEPIRATVLAIVTNRLYPLWQRLFLLGILARRLDGIHDAIVTGELDRSSGDFLADFNVTAARGSLRPAMNALPADPLAQMDAVLRLAGLMLHRSNVGPRFVECVNAFTSGIGNGPGATLASLAAQSRTAWERSFAPFFGKHPYILENYLANAVLRLNFPFGSARNPEEAERTISQRFAILAAQFALIRGLLIGVAGHHGDRFSAQHVVHTVQAASRHFEHHPEFAKQILALLAELRLDSANGLTILLREPLRTGVHLVPSLRSLAGSRHSPPRTASSSQ